MLVAQKWRVDRDAVFDRVNDLCGVDLTNKPSSDEITIAVEVLEKLRFDWSELQ